MVVVGVRVIIVIIANVAVTDNEVWVSWCNVRGPETDTSMS